MDPIDFTNIHVIGDTNIDVKNGHPYELKNHTGGELFFSPPDFFEPGLDHLLDGEHSKQRVIASPKEVCIVLLGDQTDTVQATLTVEDGSGSDDG